jgi:lipopolysaccharide transport system ATP-binding protein
MASDTLITADGVSKKFCRSLKRSLWYGVQDLHSEIRGRRHGGDGELRQDEFWAVNDVSFELKRGECLGLIGGNGAGKTTLLRMLNGLIKPDGGRIEMRGRVGALIALGAGFNPILTGRENIYVYASVLGWRKRHVDSRIEEIIEFSGIAEFMDMPVQSYSSGMVVRLGFSVAAILIEPDILFLDEVLAVGDIGFTIKCLNVVRNLTQTAAVVFVSHNMQYVSSFCSRVMVMRGGQVLLDAENPADGIDCYYSMMDHAIQVTGTGEARIDHIGLLADDGAGSDAEPVVVQGSQATIQLEITVARPNVHVILTLFIMDEAMTPIVGVPVVGDDSEPAKFFARNIKLDVPLGLVELNAGKYSIMVAVSDPSTREVLLRAQGLLPFRVYADRSYWAKTVRPSVVSDLAILSQPPQAHSPIASHR